MNAFNPILFAQQILCLNYSNCKDVKSGLRCITDIFFTLLMHLSIGIQLLFDKKCLLFAM